MGRIQKEGILALNEINCDDYNEFSRVDETDFINMKKSFLSENDSTHIFLFTAKSKSGKVFVDIYVWDHLLYPDNFKRFIICDGMRMSKADENLLYIPFE